MDENEIDKTERQVAMCLASLPSQPAPFQVLQQHLEAGWYDGLVDELAKRYSLRETTDLNADRGRHFIVTGPTCTLQLWLSLWARVAGVLDAKMNPAFFVKGAVPEPLLRALDAASVELLTPSSLSSTILDLDGESRELWEVMFYCTD